PCPSQPHDLAGPTFTRRSSRTPRFAPVLREVPATSARASTAFGRAAYHPVATDLFWARPSELADRPTDSGSPQSVPAEPLPVGTSSIGELARRARAMPDRSDAYTSNADTVAGFLLHADEGGCEPANASHPS